MELTDKLSRYCGYEAMRIISLVSNSELTSRKYFEYCLYNYMNDEFVTNPEQDYKMIHLYLFGVQKDQIAESIGKSVRCVVYRLKFLLGIEELSILIEDYRDDCSIDMIIDIFYKRTKLFLVYCEEIIMASVMEYWLTDEDNNK